MLLFPLGKKRLTGSVMGHLETMQFMSAGGYLMAVRIGEDRGGTRWMRVVEKLPHPGHDRSNRRWGGGHWACPFDLTVIVCKHM